MSIRSDSDGRAEVLIGPTFRSQHRTDKQIQMQGYHRRLSLFQQ